jgi:signal transduction histidine kinase/PAS domain-containing protein
MRSRENHIAGIVRRLTGVGQASEEQIQEDAEILANRLASFPEHNPNPVVEVDLDGNVTFMNPAAEVYVSSRDTSPGHPLAQDIGPLLGRLLGTGGGFATREITVEESTFEQKIVYIPEDLAIRIYSSDISRLRAAHESLRSAGDEARTLARENQILGEIGRIISSSLDINEVYSGFADQVRRLIDFDRLSISLVNLDDYTFTNAYILGEDVEGRQVGDVVSLEGTVTSEAVRSKRSMIIQGDPMDLKEQYPNLLGFPSIILAPLIYRRQLFGVLNARSSKVNAYTEEDAEILSRVASQITPAIANSLLYADIVRTQGDLARSNSDLEQFAYAASHDLQEPLRTITAYLGLVNDRYAGDLDDTAREFIDFAVDGAERMRTLINDLLEYSRVNVQERPLESVSCDEALNAALRSLNQAIELNGAVVKTSPLPVVTGDESQLHRLFQNLLSNALKFRGDRKPVIQVWAELQGEEWIFSVQDNGIGIAPEFQEKVFGMFSRLHSRAQYEGTGVGLALCSKIAQRHGGRIWVESDVGRGATFRFNIPVVG